MWIKGLSFYPLIMSISSGMDAFVCLPEKAKQKHIKFSICLHVRVCIKDKTLFLIISFVLFLCKFYAKQHLFLYIVMPITKFEIKRHSHARYVFVLDTYCYWHQCLFTSNCSLTKSIAAKGARMENFEYL